MLRVKSRRKRKGSSAVVSLIGPIPRLTTTTAVMVTTTTSTTTRMLVKWSAISLSVTTPKPRKAEPSRRMQLSFVSLEVAGVDRLEARFLHPQAPQGPPGRDHPPRGLRPATGVGHGP